MIFSGDLADKVLAGTKTQTRRRARCYLNGELQPCRYVVGRTYAVQDGRGRKALGRIRVLAVDLTPVGSITKADARAEGFRGPEQFYERWRQMYGEVFGRAWRIEFVLSSGSEA